RQAQILRAEGEKQAEVIKAEGEARAAVLRADAGAVAGAVVEVDSGAPAAPLLPSQASLGPGHQPLRGDDPRSIGRYQLTARLGEGGMGTVFLGRSAGERLVAVKVIRPELAADTEFRRRFGREIEAVRRVGGFHTAPVVAADPQGDPPWLITEYIPGLPLHEVLKHYGALPSRSLHTLAVGVAEALEGIHACNIVHRDLKPSNIIISGTGPRVIDFGIARALDGTTLTGSDQVIGTRGFLAPEQYIGGPVTFATDVYAFGMVLCHAGGAVPLDEGEVVESVLSMLPAPLADLVVRCLDHDPHRRPTPTQIVEHLSRSRPAAGDWLPLPVRTLVDLHSASTS
ncbi:protein kinase, partial [Kitasatospora sp. NPDC093558]|uniref:serine/threonine-protein kinase n=1 Tax=Kitasatospora sp. NPDC093558 TaxID=3155201 RepID=UPI003418E7EF